MKEYDMDNTNREQDFVLEGLAVIIQRSVKQTDPAIEVRAEMSLIDDLDLDSMGKIEIMLDVEDHFKISITDEEIKSVSTVNDLAALVMQKTE
jgi:acyl carrier protein